MRSIVRCKGAIAAVCTAEFLRAPFASREVRKRARHLAGKGTWTTAGQPKESRRDDGLVAPGDRTPQGVREPGGRPPSGEPRRGAKENFASPSPLNGASFFSSFQPRVPSPLAGFGHPGLRGRRPFGTLWVPALAQAPFRAKGQSKLAHSKARRRRSQKLHRPPDVRSYLLSPGTEVPACAN